MREGVKNSFCRHDFLPLGAVTTDLLLQGLTPLRSSLVFTLFVFSSCSLQQPGQGQGPPFEQWTAVLHPGALQGALLSVMQQSRDLGSCITYRLGSSHWWGSLTLFPHQRGWRCPQPLAVWRWMENIESTHPYPAETSPWKLHRELPFHSTPLQVRVLPLGEELTVWQDPPRDMKWLRDTNDGCWRVTLTSWVTIVSLQGERHVVRRQDRASKLTMWVQPRVGQRMEGEFSKVRALANPR